MVGSFLNWESACDLGSIYENAPRKVKIRRGWCRERRTARFNCCGRVVHDTAYCSSTNRAETRWMEVSHGSPNLMEL